MATRTVDQRASDLRGYLNRIMPLRDQRVGHQLLDKLLEQMTADPLHREAAALVAFVRRIAAYPYGDGLSVQDFDEARAILRRLE